jgi:hypothetical protein
MKCTNCNAECGNNVTACEFCGQKFLPVTSILDQHKIPSLGPTTPISAPVLPPKPIENPYAASAYESSSPPNAPNSFGIGSVPNYLPWAIASTLCCCMPAGVAAIVYAAKVDGKLASGDYQGAVEASNNAKLWSWVSFGIMAVFWAGYLGLVMMSVLLGG